jgi:glycosyltransferase involved in cell wall biosynthesis
MTAMLHDLDMTILIPTYNRAEILRETLEAMCQVERDGLAVEFVVIDNNSNDHTKEVVESFAGRLPMQYLFESRPGKNCALNKALDEVDLGGIVVLTDDDVTPREDWLKAIKGACERWPEHKVFGGPLKAVWPEGEAPGWARLPGGTQMGYGDHFPFDRECTYPLGPSGRPPGAHYWIRREVFEGGRRYNESVGPHPTIERRGSERSMLLRLKEEGHEIVYCPHALLEHRVQLELTVPQRIRKKAWANGLSYPRVNGLCQLDLLGKNRYVWFLMRVAALVYAILRVGVSQFHISESKRVGYSLEPINDVAYNIESIKLGRKRVVQQLDAS